MMRALSCGPTDEKSLNIRAVGKNKKTKVHSVGGIPNAFDMVKVPPIAPRSPVRRAHSLRATMTE